MQQDLAAILPSCVTPLTCARALMRRVLMADGVSGVLGVTREREPSKYYIEQVKTKTTAQTEAGKNLKSL